jgi:hypothetical protein
MKAREAFFAVLLKTGIITVVVSGSMAALSLPYIQAVIAVCIIVSTGIAAFFAGRIYFEPRAYEAALYYDQVVDGGERFPALRELIEEKKQGWVRDVLEQECGEIIARKTRGVFPFFRGKGKYFILPYIIVFVILVLPVVQRDRGMENGAGTSLPIVINHSSENGTFTDNPIVPDQVPASEQVPKKWEMNERDIAELTKLLNDPNIRKLVEDMVKRGSVSKSTQDKLNKDILEGNTDIEGLLSWIEKLMGGSGTGPGAGTIDRIRKALAENDLKRAAAEFEQFLKFLATRSAKPVVLTMKGRVEEYKQRSVIMNNGDYASRSGSIDIKPFPHTQYANIPFQYRETVSRYFELTQ